MTIRHLERVAETWAEKIKKLQGDLKKAGGEKRRERIAAQIAVAKREMKATHEAIRLAHSVDKRADTEWNRYS